MKVLITGANRGLGICLVRVCLEHGHQIFGTVRPDADTRELDKEMELYPARLRKIYMDVADEESVHAAAKQLGETESILDCIINNAGVLFESKYDSGDPILDLDIEMLRKTINVNTIGPALVLKYFTPMLYRSAEPCILNITSEAGHLKPWQHTCLAYGVSKHGANMYTQKIRNYLVSSPEHANTRIFMVHPGRMNTDMGKENAQIEAEEAAQGIIKIMEKDIDPKLEIPFINYKGEPMPY